MWLFLQPLVNLIHDNVLEQKYLHMDETIVQVLNEPDKAAQSQSYMWVLRSTLPTCVAVLFHYEPTRSGSLPSLLLRDFISVLSKRLATKPPMKNTMRDSSNRYPF